MEIHFFHYDKKTENKPVLLDEITYFLTTHKLSQRGYFYVYVIKNDKIIAIGMLYKNKFHPYRDYIFIYVDTEFRNLSIGHKILKQLEDHSKLKKFQCSISSSQINEVQFLKIHNFQCIRKSFDGQITQIQSQNKHLNTNENVYSLSSLNTSLLNQLKSLLHTNYSKYHMDINPLEKSIDAQQFFDILNSPEKIIDLNQSTVLLSKLTNFKSVIAYLFILKSIDDHTEVIYLGGNSEDDLLIYLEYFSAQIQHLLNHYSHIYLEADNTDFYAYSFANHLKLDLNTSFDTYIKN